MLLVATYWRTNLTRRQLGPLFGVSHSAEHRVIDTTGPLLALAPVRKRRVDAVAIVDGTLVPTRDHRQATPSKNYRSSTNVQVTIDAETRLVIATGEPQPGSRNDCTVYRACGIAEVLAGRPVMADGGYQGNPEVIMPYRKPRDGSELPGWKEDLKCHPPQGPCLRRARAGPDEELQDPPRLPSRGEHARRHGLRHRAPAQHPPHRLTATPVPPTTTRVMRHPLVQGSSLVHRVLQTCCHVPESACIGNNLG
ncbi:transposase IS4 family protein [Amycolatopsis mediterranei S699]|uniref:Transposase IS4 family protein n=1 Tax=Amycolatopsis mediterranei (strain S699) TaxID=713604 RepID=A0A9R0P176_AMYMS|nr:transposase IS4 family protein [Amycolatopsis mediterranei S699]